MALSDKPHAPVHARLLKYYAPTSETVRYHNGVWWRVSCRVPSRKVALCGVGRGRAKARACASSVFYDAIAIADEHIHDTQLAASRFVAVRGVGARAWGAPGTQREIDDLIMI